MARTNRRPAPTREALAALELARVTYQAAVLDVVRAPVRENVAGRVDDTILLVHWVTFGSPNSYDLAGELEESLSTFPESAQAALRTMIERLRAYGAAADAVRDTRLV